MSNGEKKQKDGWDILDIVGKLLTPVLLGVLTITIKFGTDKIQQGSDRVAASQRKGQLVQSLVSDLSKPETGTQQDIAIIALDRSVGADDPSLVLDIAEQIVRNRKYSDIVALGIIRQRDPSRAEKLEKEIFTSLDDPKQREKLISNADTSSQAEKASTTDSKLISTIFPNLVYLQFQGAIQRSVVEDFRKSISEQGITAPGVQRVAGSYVSNVRYFNGDDQEQAKSLAAKATQFFESRGCPGTFKVNDLSNSKFNTPKGHLEIWINLTCTK